MSELEKDVLRSETRAPGLESYLPLVEAGLQGAAALGFDLSASLQANYGSAYDGARNSPEQVVETAASLAAAAELDASFFQWPAGTVLLLCAADSWVGTARRVAEQPVRDPTVAAERDALADILLITAGAHSGVVRALRKSDPQAAEQYARFDRPLDEKREEAEAYLKGLEILGLAEEVRAPILQTGPGSLLEGPRRRLGIPELPEQPFEVRVLGLALSHPDLVACGFIGTGESEGPESATHEQAEPQEARNPSRHSAAAQYLAANDEYMKRFGERFGKLAPAWMSRDQDGRVILTLTAPYALGLLNPATAAHYRRVIWHEFMHTQRPMHFGPFGQLGLAVEEMRAYWGSDGAGGYRDAVFGFQELAHITGVEVADLLEQVAKTPDTLSSFLCAAAGKFGLRTLLHVMALVPGEYWRDAARSGQFVNMRFLQPEDWESVAGAIVRDTLRRLGIGQARPRIWARVAALAVRGMPPAEAAAEADAAAGAGITCTQSLYEEALRMAYGDEDPHPVHGLTFAIF